MWDGNGYEMINMIYPTLLTVDITCLLALLSMLPGLCSNRMEEVCVCGFVEGIYISYVCNSCVYQIVILMILIIVIYSHNE